MRRARFGVRPKHSPYDCARRDNVTNIVRSECTATSSIGGALRALAASERRRNGERGAAYFACDDATTFESANTSYCSEAGLFAASWGCRIPGVRGTLLKKRAAV